MSKAPYPRIVPLIVAAALFMETLDMTVIATALPAIAHALKVNPLHLSLAITSYLLGLAAFIPLSGWMADRYGARHVFRAAIVVFTLGSILCGVSRSMFELVGARLIQGAGGAMMVPVGRLALLRTVPKSELVSAMTYVTVPALLGPVLGPPLGGFIVTYSSWRWIFFINVPVGLLGIALVSRYIENFRASTPPRLDLYGWILSALGLACLLFGLETVGRGLLPQPLVVTLIAGGVACFVLYVMHARRTSQPVLDFTLLKLDTFRASLAGGFLVRTSIGALPFLVPLLLQLGMGYAPHHAGLVLLTGALGAIAVKPFASALLRRYGFKRLLIANSVLSALTISALALVGTATPALVIMLILLVSGFFRSLQMTAVNSMGYADVPPKALSQATSLAAVAQQFAMCVGVGVAALVLHVALHARAGESVTADDFAPAFLAIALLTALSSLVFLPLKRDAGQAVSGHRLEERAPV
jgi:EmrB/QacA subfamily drug resistance transporter